MKKPSGLLSMIGFGSKKNNPERHYLCFLDEHYLYFLKDVEVSKENKNFRKIGKNNSPHVEYRWKSVSKWNSFVPEYFSILPAITPKIGQNMII